MAADQPISPKTGVGVSVESVATPTASNPPSDSSVDLSAKAVEDKEALQYWGYLVKPDKCGTKKLNSLLAGIAQYIADKIEPKSDCCTDLTPAQLAAFYRAVGGNYDVLFVDTPHSSISFIYKSLGCLHSIQPLHSSDGYAMPTLPALKPKGFVTWQTIQLLLGPEEHVPFLQHAVKNFDIVDPETGEKFPKVLPEEAFPATPNQEMLDWYDKVSERLKQEAEACAKREEAERVGRLTLSMSEDFEMSESDNDRDEAAKYFSNPLYKDRGGRPTIVRRYESSRGDRNNRSPRQVLEQRGRQVMHSVRHFLNPNTSKMEPGGPRRGSASDQRYPAEVQSDDGYEDVTPTGLYPAYAPKPKPRRPRSTTEVYTDSEEEDTVKVSRRPALASRRTSSSKDRERDKNEQERVRERVREREFESPGSNSSKHSTPPLRHRRSHEPATSPIDYFPRQHYDDAAGAAPRRHSHAHAGHYATSEPGGGFAPSTEPLFASKVAQMQSSSRRESASPRRPPEERMGSYYGRPTVRYSRRNIEPIAERPPPYSRERRSDERPAYTRERRSDEREVPPSYSRERIREREREREKDDGGGAGYGRSRSYDRDEEMDRRKMERERRGYVEGAGGRRYPTYT